jgi:uncharacterized OsmC-like protein
MMVPKKQLALDLAQYYVLPVSHTLATVTFMERGVGVSERNFNMRLKCRYQGDTNEVDSLDVEHRVEDEWVSLDMGLASPGFDIFVYSIFTCQHRFFRVVCAERQLLLESAEGSITIGADKDWHIKTLRVHFSGQLAAGHVSADDIEAVVSRMQQCPVSRNLAAIPHAETTISLA